MFARRNSIALLALFVALGGTGYAAVEINGKKIEKGTISGTALKSDTLTGKQIRESKLGQVPSAKTADSAKTAISATSAATATTATHATDAANAAALGGVAPSGYLTPGCHAGTVAGFALIQGGAASFPTTFTSDPTFVTGFNCTGQPVQVRRGSAGVYFVKFLGNADSGALASPEACVAEPTHICGASPLPAVSATPVTSAESTGDDVGSFQLRVENPTGGFEDATVVVSLT
jgi:hypothetical protein